MQLAQGDNGYRRFPRDTDYPDITEFDTLVGKLKGAQFGMVEERVKELLFCGEELSNSDIAALINRLSAMTLKNLKLLAKSLGIRLTGSSRKGEGSTIKQNHPQDFEIFKISSEISRFHVRYQDFTQDFNITIRF